MKTLDERINDLEDQITKLKDAINHNVKTARWQSEEYDKRIGELEAKVRAFEVGLNTDPFGMRGI